MNHPASIPESWALDTSRLRGTTGMLTPSYSARYGRKRSGQSAGPGPNGLMWNESTTMYSYPAYAIAGIISMVNAISGGQNPTGSRSITSAKTGGRRPAAPTNPPAG